MLSLGHYKKFKMFLIYKLYKFGRKKKCKREGGFGVGVKGPGRMMTNFKYALLKIKLKYSNREEG